MLLYGAPLLECSCLFNQGTSGKCGCGGVCCCLKSHFSLIKAQDCICLPRQRRSPPLIVSSERGVFVCEGRERTRLCFCDPLLSDRAPDAGTNGRDGATQRPVTSAFQDKQRLNHSWSCREAAHTDVWGFFFMGYLVNAKAASEMKGSSKV